MFACLEAYQLVDGMWFFSIRVMSCDVGVLKTSVKDTPLPSQNVGQLCDVIRCDRTGVPVEE